MTVWSVSAGLFRGPVTAQIAPDEALSRLYDEQSQSLLRLAALLVWAIVPETVAEIAEEIVHDAYAGMHREWRLLRDADKAVAYLRRAIVHSARLLAAAASSERAVVLASTGDEVLAALRVMPCYQREALVLRYYADLPEAQAADAMGVTKGAFRWHVAQGMTSLRAFLDQGPLSTGTAGYPRLIPSVAHRVCTAFLPGFPRGLTLPPGEHPATGRTSPGGVLACWRPQPPRRPACPRWTRRCRR